MNKKEKKTDIYLTNTLIAILFFQPITYFVNVVFNLIVSQGFIWDTIIMLIILLSIIATSIPSLISRIKKDTIYISLILLFLYTGSMFINIEYSYIYTGRAAQVFVFALPVYIYVRSIKNYDFLLTRLIPISKIVVLVSILTYVIQILSNTVNIDYMVFSYNLLFPLIITTYSFIQLKDNSSLLLSTLGIIVVFVGGARGPLLAFFTFIALMIFHSKNRKFDIKSALLLIVLVTAIIYIKELALVLNQFLNSFGIYSRNLSKIILGEFFDSSGRIEIINSIIAVIKENPFSLGIFNDTIALLKYNSSYIGLYSHNIVLQLISEYGLFFGFFALIVLLISIVNIILRKSNILSTLIIMVIPLGLIKLMYTGSYITEPYFYMLIGLIYSYYMNRKESLKK